MANKKKPNNLTVIRPAEDANLDKSAYDKADGLMTQLIEVRQSIGAGILKQGEILADMRDTLKGAFYRFVQHRIPSLSTASITRYISAWENAKKLPEPILKASLAGNIDLVGPDKNDPFGKYSDVVKKLPMPRQVDDKKAEEYVKNVIDAYAESRKKGKPGRKKSVNWHDAMRQAFTTTFRVYDRIRPSEKDIEFVNQLCGYLLYALDVRKEITIKPVEIPSEVMEGKPRGRGDAKKFKKGEAKAA